MSKNRIIFANVYNGHVESQVNNFVAHQQNNYYGTNPAAQQQAPPHDKPATALPAPAAAPGGETKQPQKQPTGREKVISELATCFWNDEVAAAKFLSRIDGAKPTAITDEVNALLKQGVIARACCNKDLWNILHSYSLYKPSLSNWNQQVNA